MLHGARLIHDDVGGYTNQAMALLNEIEPDGPRGNVQLGLTFPLHLFNFYKKVDGAWVYDEDYIKPILAVCRSLKRPVVFQLTCNHFAHPTQLVYELVESSENIMTFFDGSISDDKYFYKRIFAFTLMTDPELPVNHYRFQAIKKVIKKKLHNIYHLRIEYPE